MMTLKPFISSPSSEHFSSENHTRKRQTSGNIISIGLNVTCAAFAVSILVFMVWGSSRVSQLEAEIKSVTRLVEGMKKKLGIDYLDDLTDLEYANSLIDDPTSADEENGTLLSSVLDSSDPAHYDDDENDDILDATNDNYGNDDDDDMEDDDHENNDHEDDISTTYRDNSESDSYENDGDNLYDDFEKYKDAKKLSRKTRSTDSIPKSSPVFSESYAQRINNSEGPKMIKQHFSHRNEKPSLRSLEPLSSETHKNNKEIYKRRAAAKTTEKGVHHRPHHPRNHLNQMCLHNRRIRAMLKSGTGRTQTLSAPSASRIVAAHYHLNNTISGKHVLHSTHSTLAHDGDVYIGAPHSWAKHLGTNKFFNTNYGVLIIQERGLYLVYAQIYYENRFDRNGYVVYHNTHPFLICSAYIPTNVNKSHTCYTSGLIYLEQNDEIHLRDIHRDRVVSLSNAKSFFGLAKIDGIV